MQNSFEDNCIYIRDKKIKIYKTVPKSSVLEYDYNGDSRYVLSYHNHFELYDRITNMILLSLCFSDEVEIDLKDIIYSLFDNFEVDNNDEFREFDIVSIDIPIDYYKYASIIFQREYDNIIMEIYVKNKMQESFEYEIKMQMTQAELEAVYNLLDSDELYV